MFPAVTRRYAFLGPEGTFAHAASRAFALSGQESVPYPTVSQAVDALRSSAVDGAVVPLENSVEGAVPATLDELATGRPLIITAETFLPVAFDLVARPGTELSQVRRIATHPHAEAQVRRRLLELAPLASVAMVGSTAAGALAVRDHEYDAAVSAPIAGELYGLTALATNIADNPGAVTRFVLLAHPHRPPAPTGNDRTSLVTYLRADHAGALLEMLTEFATRGVNLTRIESRPTKEQLGQYSFSIDCEGHIADQRVGAAFAALRRICADVRYLGSYPRRDGQQGPVPAGRADTDFTRASEWLDGIRNDGV